MKESTPPAVPALRPTLEQAFAQLEERQLELELANQQLQDQASELEMQAEELQATAAQLEERTEEAERARREAEAAERRLQAAFAQAPALVAVTEGPEHRYVLANTRAEEVAARGPLVGRTYREVFPELEAQGFAALLDRVYRTGEPFVATEVPVTLDRGAAGKDVTWYSFVYQPLVDAAGRVTGIMQHAVDVSPQVRARQATVEGEQAARHEAEAAQQRVAFLAEASARLAASLDVESTLRTLSDLAVPALADWCFVEVREEDGTIRSAAVAHQDSTKVAFVSEILRRYPLDPDAPFGTGHVLRTGEPEVAPEIPDELLATIAQDAEHLALVRSVGMKSSISVPLFAPDGRPVAVLSLVSAESGRRFGPADLAMAEEVARRASVALASARLYAAEQAALRRAAVLQRVTAGLSGTLTAEQAATLVLEQTVALLNAEGGVVLRTSDDGASLEVIGAVGYPESAVQQWRRFPTNERVPLAEAVRRRGPVFVESLAAWRERFGERGLLRELSVERSWAALPFVAEGRVLGVMGLSFPREGPVSAEDRTFVTALAQQCAQAFERARLFDAERSARAEAERANRAKGEFLAVMSHELRTPLNAIGGYAELLAMGIRGPVTEQQRADLERIQRSQKHLLGLINEVLNYAKLETGSVRYDVADVFLRDALAAAEGLVAPQVRAKGLTLVTSDCAPDVAVRADAEKLRQVLVNLLSNAVKFTDRGGRVDLSCEVRGDRVYVIVRDTGIGIPADKLEAIFEPFVQVRADLTRTAEGTGLGLAISRDLARGMGGDLTVQSEPGAGSTFTLTLPRA